MPQLLPVLADFPIRKFLWHRRPGEARILFPIFAGNTVGGQIGGGRWKEHEMNLTYAVDRLLEAGWLPSDQVDLERLPDGRSYPSIAGVKGEFARVGLQLSIKHNLMFNCYRATWAPSGERLDPSHVADERHGTVVGACEREAAVYALAQLRAAQAELQLAGT
jgi:hypothetical protein